MIGIESSHVFPIRYIIMFDKNNRNGFRLIIEITSD